MNVSHHYWEEKLYNIELQMYRERSFSLSLPVANWKWVQTGLHRPWKRGAWRGDVVEAIRSRRNGQERIFLLVCLFCMFKTKSEVWSDNKIDACISKMADNGCIRWQLLWKWEPATSQVKMQAIPSVGDDHHLCAWYMSNKFIHRLIVSLWLHFDQFCVQFIHNTFFP